MSADQNKKEEPPTETSRQAGISISKFPIMKYVTFITVKAGNELFRDIDNIENLMAAEEKKNAELKRRNMYLIPFNFAVIWGTLRYCANINNFAKKWWPSR